MNLPNLPTDSVYKFTTILGLAITLAGATVFLLVPWQEFDRRAQLAEKTLESLSALTEKTVVLGHDTRHRAAAFARESLQGGAITEAERDVLLSQLKNEAHLYDAICKITDAQSDTIRRNADLAADIGKSRLDLAMESGPLLIKDGLLITLFGLVLWWLQHQRFQDRLLYAQMLKAEAEAPAGSIVRIGDVLRAIRKAYRRSPQEPATPEQGNCRLTLDKPTPLAGPAVVEALQTIPR